MKQLDTYIDINAPVQRVWDVLVDLPNYGAWNPFIYHVEGSCRLNEIIGVRMHIPGKGFQKYQVRLTSIENKKAFFWLGHFHVRGLIDGDHRFELSVLPNGLTRVRQCEYFRGLMVPFVWKSYLVRHLLPCFDALNINLQAWCENRPLPVALPKE